MAEKKEFDKKFDLESEKNKVRSLLENMANEIKAKEETNWNDTKIDDMLLEFSQNAEKITTKEELDSFLNKISEQIAEKEISDELAKEEYQQFKELLRKLDEELEQIKKTHIQKTQKKLSNLQKWILDANNLTPAQLKALAKKWREKAANSIDEWIVSKLAERDDWIWTIARKASWLAA